MKTTKDKILLDMKSIALTMFTKDFIDLERDEQYKVFATVIKNYISEYWLKKNKEVKNSDKKQVYYFSLEFLLGKMLESNILNLGLEEPCKEALEEFGITLKDLEKYDAEPGLGNAGLGRFSACFLDSMASVGVFGHGNGIRYDYGLFEQKIVNGEQIEGPDNWLKNGFVWETKKNHQSQTVKFYGEVSLKEVDGKLLPVHVGYNSVLAIPYDIPIVGYQNEVVNTLRLWQAKIKGNDFDFNSFSYGIFSEIDEKRRNAEAISKLLYPDDSTESGKILRLKQEYFLVSAGLQNIVSYYDRERKRPESYPDLISIQINGTSSALCIAEFMRILVDEKRLEWNEAWEITQKVMSFTSHTIATKSTGRWEIDKIRKVIPRVYMIIEEINRRFCAKIYKKTKDWALVEKVAIIENKHVNMLNLTVVGCHSINGVSEPHSEILKKSFFKTLYELEPEKFNNKTNGITHRRWLLKSNKNLTNLLDHTIGDGWKKDTLLLEEIGEYSENTDFLNKLQDVKFRNKESLAKFIFEETKIEVDINSIFDTHIKRFDSSKRQLLTVLYIIYLYNEIIANSEFNMYPKTFIFSSKTAAGNYLAKRTIRLINHIAEMINNDVRVNKFMKIVFIPNYGVSKAEIIIPGSDINEQISAIGTEASGTSNMKFMMNGALTLGTYEGSNVEMSKYLGEENIFIFGMRRVEKEALEAKDLYNPMKILKENKKLMNVVEKLRDGTLGRDFTSLYSYLVDGDRFYVLKDFEAYLEAQMKVEALYTNRVKWNSMAAKNIAKSGIFSGDNTVRKYAKEIWDIEV
ncbi:MAG: glycogen/starch/alpha-glucan family phosphorylase [Psychrilyobacter sp.]|nr:glycogen/starch/alpha-glucan family phosphorylase [Psychrilyobacter sp.]